MFQTESKFVINEAFTDFDMDCYFFLVEHRKELSHVAQIRIL